MAGMTQENVLAPWLAQQSRQLLAQRGHAWLLQGPSGLGQYSLGLALVRAWLCEQATEQGACGTCPSCHAIEVRTHADLCVLMPETVMLELGWPLDEKSQSDIDEKKRKPSKEIRIEAMRNAIEFAQRTSARGRGKAVLVYPAERMNHVTANALLKTLEEPPGDVRFVLASEAAHQLLPTIRSRCLTHTMTWPTDSEALTWLQGQGLAAADARTLLRAAGGRPDDALAFAATGREPKSWRSLPRAMQRGELAVVADWSPVQLVDALHKLCHDLLALGSGATPRYFDAGDLPPPPALPVLSAWQRELGQESRSAEHPFNTGLMIEALVSRAQTALN
jgi:DNA polymerase-3 subunit delta'